MLSRSIVLDTEHLDHVVRHFSRHGAFFFDIESIPPYRGIPAHNTVSWISLATYGMAVTIPMGHIKGDRIIGERVEMYETKTGKIRKRKIPVWSTAPEQLRPSQVFEALEPLLFSDREKGAHSLPMDVGSVAKYYGGKIPPPPYHDTYTSSVLLDENRLNGLKPRIKQLYKIAYDTEDTGRRVEAHSFRKVARYSYADSALGWLLYKHNDPLIDKQGLRDLFDMEMELLEEVIDMAAYGDPVDKAVLEELERELTAALVEHEARIYRAVGREFNLNSPPQKAQVFWGPKEQGGLGLKPVKLTDGGVKKKRRGEKLTITDWSTDADSLKKYKGHPAVDAMLDYQRDDKLKGTYVDALLHPDEDDCLIINGRVHARFNPMGARTGRWSSSSPNLQNIPVRTPQGKKIRSAFRAEDDYLELIADYGQIELVMLAHFIGYGALFDGFWKGIDPHTITAALVFALPPDEVKANRPDLRSIAKGLNFAIVYGAGPDTVAEMAEITVNEARKHMKKHRAEFPEVYAYKAHVIDTARRQKYPHTTTLLGRVRRMPELRSRDDEKRSAAERQLFNSKIQGSAADLIKLAMIRWRRNHPAGAHMTRTVHDEVGVHTPKHLVEESKAALLDAMVGPGIQKLVKVPLTVDIHAVERWSDAK
ncbi:DNA polymerase [Microbispora sp. NPDC049633]|uniref:DNA polymerase n=1 Tax=Microbispora sp. NPDC049633 TaxID=3154355 RepID=UPI003413C6F4